MENTVALALSLLVLGQVFLSVSLLTARIREAQTYLPLMMFFLASGLIAVGPVVTVFAPTYYTAHLSILPPLFLMLGPVFWLYSEGLMSETRWRLRTVHFWHYVPVLLGCIATGLIMSMSIETRELIFVGGATEDLFIGTGDTLHFPGFVVIYLFLILLLWLGQSAFYVQRTFRRLSQYKTRLKDVFSNTEKRDLGWVTVILWVVGGAWLVFFLSLIADNFLEYQLLSQSAGSVLWLLIVWSLSVWGLRQKPGFEGEYLKESSRGSEIDMQAPKYSRSALADDQAGRIAKKIHASMEGDELYLDPNLSLQKLAKHVAVTPNHISQTLNDKMGMNFFDYVNGWRIDAAKPLIEAGEETVLAVAFAVG
ncbi:MAG: helix-turn-helix domain-containing protein, partial [Kordiimonas sp.]